MASSERRVREGAERVHESGKSAGKEEQGGSGNGSRSSAGSVQFLKDKEGAECWDFGRKLGVFAHVEEERVVRLLDGLEIEEQRLSEGE